ncbi:MAG: CBS and ACT domain-containing protein [Bacillota bacterium]
MFVKDYMTAAPITITPATPVLEALEIMKRHEIRHLPVADRGKLVGLVTERGLLTVSPSPATTLSVYEMNYLLAKMTVKEAMVKSLITTTPAATIEDAALIMRDKKVGCLPVLEAAELVGIITQTDIFDSLVDIFGLRKAGVRIVVETRNRLGVLADILGVVRENNIHVIGVACLDRDDGKVYIMLRLRTAKPETIVESLKAAGFKVAYGIENEGG